MLRFMGEDGARGKDWLRARGITCVLQTQFSSLYLNWEKNDFYLRFFRWQRTLFVLYTLRQTETLLFQ